MGMCLLLSAQSDLQPLLASPLHRCGLSMDVRQDVRQADANLRYEVVVVDLRRRTGRVGFGDTVCFEVRRRWSAYILAFVDQHDAIGKTLVLEMGADALMSPPFSDAEIEARVRSLRRRTDQAGVALYRDPMPSPVPASWLDTHARRLRMPGARWLDLSGSECAVLDALIAQPGRAMSRGELMARTGLALGSRNPNIVDLAVSRLRRKLSLAGMDESLIETVRGQGYAWTGRGVVSSDRSSAAQT